MTEHHLTNARVIPGTDAVCAHCGGELYRITDLTDIYTRSPGLTFCNEDGCYTQWALEYGGTNPTKIDDRRQDADLLHAKAAQQAAEVAAHRQRVIADTVAWQAANRGHSDKSIARQTGEAAANIVGFIIWIIVVSAIAAVIFAATGIDSMW